MIIFNLLIKLNDLEEVVMKEKGILFLKKGKSFAKKFPLFFLIFNLLPLLYPMEEPVRIKEEKVVVVSRIPSSKMDTGRQVTIITREEILSSPVKTIPELLKYACGLDFQERGNFGVQADLSLRGSTFQQVLILIDGVRVNDLQTAHHNMDIPVPLESIERIEILHGNGSSLYGADAMGGVINIVTKKPEKTRLSGKFGYYDFGTFSGSTGLEIKREKFSNILSFQREASKGFMEDREFSNFSVSNKFSFDFSGGNIEILASHGDKKFGAFDFYTPGMNFPSWESTKTDILSAKLEKDFGKWTFSQSVYYRNHFDRFFLDRNRPAFYINETKNKNIGTNFLLRRGNFAIGGEFAKEFFDSSKAGNHSNFRSAIFIEKKLILLQKIFFNIGIREDFHEKYKWSLSPDISFTYFPFSFVRIRTSAGSSFRAPSYTELYYRDPVNIGNPSLKPEKGISYEFGVDTFFKNIETKFSLFQREESYLIDWVKRDGKWYAENIRGRNIRGVEIEVNTDNKYFKISLKSSFYDMREKESAKIYKYGFRIPKSQSSILLNLKSTQSLFASFQILYKRRFYEKSYILMDAKIVKKIGSLEIFLEGTNLTNKKYEDIPGVPMPGRWIGGGVLWKM